MKRIENLYRCSQTEFSGGYRQIPEFSKENVFQTLSESRMSDMFFATVIGNHRVGLELEYENATYDLPRFKHWEVKQDGSLRGHGIEFVTKDMSVNSLESAFTEITPILWMKSNFTTGVRTSVHVHHNIRRRTIEELKSFLALYLLFERSLFTVAGPERIDSRFCVPLNYCINAAATDTQTIINQRNKYCALGFYRTQDLGTVEFRQHEGCKDVYKLLNWVALGYMLLYNARAFPLSTIEDWVLAYVKGNESLETLGNRVFSPLYFPINKEWEELANTNVLSLLSNS